MVAVAVMASGKSIIAIQHLVFMISALIE